MEEKVNLNDFESIIVIELGRIYDLLSIIASGIDLSKTQAVIKLHEQGQILAPPPAIEVKDDTN